MTAPAGADPTPAEATDGSLLRRLQAGEADAATALYAKYARQLRAVAVRQRSAAVAARVDPDDIVQSVFRTFFRRAVTDRYAVPAGDDLWKLFLVIALNKLRSAAAYHTAAKRDARRTVPLADAGGGPAVADDAGDTLTGVIDECLAALPDSAARMVRLRIDGCEVADIAARTGRSKRSVERVLQQFRDHLKRLLHDHH